MPVIENDRVTCMDVDDTLIFWSRVDADLPVVNINGRDFQIHTKHLQKIKDHHLMGFHVIIWSMSGHRWAHTVAKALGVESIVTCMCKPHRVFDDAKNLGDTIGHGYIPIKDKK